MKTHAIRIHVNFAKVGISTLQQKSLMNQLAARLVEYYQNVIVKGHTLLVDSIATWSTVYGRAKDIMMGLCFTAEVTVSFS